MRFGEEVVFALSRPFIRIIEHHVGESVYTAELFCWGTCASDRLFDAREMRVALLALPLFDIKEVVHLVSWTATLDHKRVIDVLKVSADCHLVLLVILINEALIATNRSERYSRLLVKTPSIKLLAELLRIELVRLALHLGIWVFIVLVIDA